MNKCALLIYEVCYFFVCEDLARLLGRRQAYVSKYELGERRLDLLELIAVCDSIGISLSDFVARFELERKQEK